MVRKAKLLVDVNGIPAGTECTIIHDPTEHPLVDDVEFMVRCCGLDLFVGVDDLEVIESESIGASQSAREGSQQAVGSDTSDGENDVSGVCGKCGAVLREAEPVGQ
jgi:hypothetical protein